ncbi:HAMP domain-containing histidine kinase [Patescibacteria group bacterium]|nr:HAMP domain-containing histidine kinase [Patescibacteria group bacterium]
MLISIIFSLVIYTTITRELGRGFRQAETRLRAEELGLPVPRQLPKHFEELGPQLVEDLAAANKRVVLNLIILNGIILVVSTAAGYFLAGKTLGPIETAMEEQRRFVADASHELRTPLTALKTTIEVALREKKLTIKEAEKVLESNLEDIEDLESLTNNLLSLAQYQQGNNAFVLQPVKIGDVIQTSYKKISPLAKKKDIDIKIKTSEHIIEGNKQSLEEMMLIFLDNAVKYTPKGGRVRITTKSNKKKLIIKIKDTGIGIAKKDIPYIFDRFYRVDQSRSKDNVLGFGLGLSLAKQIIELHKGTVTVSSVLGKGSTFTLKLLL